MDEASAARLHGVALSPRVRRVAGTRAGSSSWRRHAVRSLAVLALTLLVPAAGPVRAAASLAWRVVAVHPHDPQAFTQGLLHHQGRLYESTGLRGRSSLRVVEPHSGRVLLRRDLDRDLFGEGLARAGDRLYQLTWTSGRGFVYAIDDLRVLGEFRYRGEGWGLAHDGERLFMSDGSDRLKILSPDGFRVQGELRVRDGGQPVFALNELEFARGDLYANVWRTDRIARIDVASGVVTGWLDLQGLLGPARANADVLNGIAYDAGSDRFWVTGKLWPRIFVLEVAE